MPALVPATRSAASRGPWLGERVRRVAPREHVGNRGVRRLRERGQEGARRIPGRQAVGRDPPRPPPGHRGPPLLPSRTTARAGPLAHHRAARTHPSHATGPTTERPGRKGHRGRRALVGRRSGRGAAGAGPGRRGREVTWRARWSGAVVTGSGGGAARNRAATSAGRGHSAPLFPAQARHPPKTPPAPRLPSPPPLFPPAYDGL
ncbi:hypothetical protein Shyhy01_49270 [Streptomyces hygroscopicus subsp. hygroscopicus]|nr:hypothetical protein Shyhy01_49270 [Streptomyces hygroscopicus subsp. hygroscopicus]